MSNQKYPRGTRVRVAEDLGPSMSHFEGKGEEAIVEYTYAQEYGWMGGTKDYTSYSLVLLNEMGLPYNSVSWYEEHQLTLIGIDIPEGLAIIEALYQL